MTPFGSLVERRGNKRHGEPLQTKTKTIFGHGLPRLRLVVLHLFIVASIVTAQDFAPPPGLQKYSFYPQAGNFWDDLFPTNHVDLDPGPGTRDYHCSGYTYDGHEGIDTSIVTFDYMAIGVPIFAALDGQVIDAHDGEFDMSTTFTVKPITMHVTPSRIFRRAVWSQTGPSGLKTRVFFGINNDAVQIGVVPDNRFAKSPGHQVTDLAEG